MDEITGWALRAAEGDPVACSAFVRGTQAEVWRLCASLVDPGVADDLTQESYLRAFRALPAFEARSTARTWLLGITRRACADHLRGVVRRRRLELALRQRATATAATVADPASGAAASDLLAQLVEERRGSFVLTQVLGLSYQEAATVEGVPVGTIRSRVARARSELIELLAEAAAS